ncbi:hypothetical protein [Sphingobacterium sp.]|uniref:hypothetical protein n=1 Tax=Sphingobacterium sp. TaxID=341027 RepID=UPI0028AF07C1|nr:hypothetical protein [Sphingobacterium sp.]
MKYYQEIAIYADLELIQELLIRYDHIEVWERGFEIFKELIVDDKESCIIHWDIEKNIDYTYRLKENILGTKLCLEANGLEEDLDGLEVQFYMQRALKGIKERAEENYFFCSNV